MPGEATVEFVAEAQAQRLVQAVGELAGNTSAPFVLVGGLAVAARLKTYHRATQDLDAVVGEERRQFQQQTIEAVGRAVLDADQLTVDGVAVDIIDVDPTVEYEDTDDLDDPNQRLFVAGHLFAYRDAGPVVLKAGAAMATVTVASARALLIAKFGAYLSPRRDPRKHSSDGLDIYELARVLITEPTVYAGTPPVVMRSLQWAASQVAAHPGELLRRLNLAGRTVTVPEIAALVGLLAEIIQ